MNDEQRYLFDSRGVFTLPGALSLSHVRPRSMRCALPACLACLPACVGPLHCLPAGACWICP